MNETRTTMIQSRNGLIAEAMTEIARTPNSRRTCAPAVSRPSESPS